MQKEWYATVHKNIESIILMNTHTPESDTKYHCNRQSLFTVPYHMISNNTVV